MTTRNEAIFGIPPLEHAILLLQEALCKLQLAVRAAHHAEQLQASLIIAAEWRAIYAARATLIQLDQHHSEPGAKKRYAK